MTSEEFGVNRGASYLATIPLEARRLSGLVYTPLDLVEFILGQAGYDSSEPLETKTLLDPACGAGVFLATAVARQAQRLELTPGASHSRHAQNEFLAAVSNTIFGVDVDRTACELARGVVRRVVKHILGVKLAPSFFRTNVVCADYLLDRGVTRLPPMTAGGFDYIIGNPPYVSTTRLTRRYKRRLKRHFATAAGRVDLYTLFIDRSIALLRELGRLAFITPDKFLLSMTSTRLRSALLSAGAPLTIATFRSHRIFDGAATVPCVFVFERNSKSSDVSVLECHKRNVSGGGVAVTKRLVMPVSHLSGKAWHLSADFELLDLAERIRAQHRRLETVVRRISAGIATGLDDVFVVPRSIDLEQELRRPAVRGRDLSPFHVADEGLDIVLPYAFRDAERPSLVDIRRFPRTRRYLENVKLALRSRHCVRVWGKAWYDLHDPIGFDIAGTPKILVPDVASYNRFAYDPGKVCPLHSAYYIVPGDIAPLFLTAVLNSKPIEFLLRLSAPTVKDGFSRYRRQFLMPLPVPILPKEEERRIGENVRAGNIAAVEDEVLALFGLRDSELRRLFQFLEIKGPQERRSASHRG